LRFVLLKGLLCVLVPKTYDYKRHFTKCYLFTYFEDEMSGACSTHNGD